MHDQTYLILSINHLSLTGLDIGNVLEGLIYARSLGDLHRGYRSMRQLLLV